MQSSTFKIAPFISLYAFGHLVIDAACAYLFLGVLEINSNAIVAMLVYNAIAFALQSPLGFIIDQFLNPKYAAIMGLLLVALAFLFWENVYSALIIVSLGNALFHVGGGSLVLSLKNKLATFSGIFVAPGAMGLAIGSFLSTAPFNINILAFPILLLVLCGLVYFVVAPTFNRIQKSPSCVEPSTAVVLILLIMVPIAVRSVIGLSIDFPWKQHQYLALINLAAVVLGNVFGGILADKYGLMKVGVGALLLSTPLLAFYSTIPLIGILGIFAFNFTMPVTLIAMLKVMPKYRGLSFGLTTVALFMGSLPVILGETSFLEIDYVVFSSILLSSVVLFAVLHYMSKLNLLKA